MNKEQMLELLKDIQIKIKNENLDEYDIDNRVAEIENLKEEISNLDSRIQNLNDKLNNESNYRNLYFMLNDEALRYDLNKAVKDAEIEVRQNNAAKTDLNEAIARANEAIQKSSLEIGSLQNDALFYGQELRELGETPNQDDEQTISQELNTIRERIAYLNNQNERLQNRIIVNNERLTQLNNLTTSLDNNLISAQTALDNFDNNTVNTPIINEAQRKADKKELDTIEHERKELVNREKVLSLDYSAEFGRIIEDLENDTINVEQASARVGSVMNNIPDGYFIDDIETRDRELETNRAKQKEVSLRIERLNEKLKNDDNYSVSAFVAERNNSEVKNWENKVANLELRKAELDKENITLENELHANEAMEQECDKEIFEKGQELRSFGNSITTEDENKIREELNYLRREKLNHQNTANEIRVSLIENANNSLETENKIEKSKNILENLKNTLETRNTVDRSERRLDEQRLAAAVASLNALKNREKFIEKSVAEVINKAVGVEEVPFAPEMGIKNDNPTSTFETPNLVNDVQASKVEEENNEKEEVQNKVPTYNPLEDSINEALKERGIPAKVDITTPISDASELNEETKEENIVPAVENNQEDTNELVEENEQEEIEPEKKRFKHKFKDAKDSLVRKAKSPEFKKKLSNFAKKAAAIAALLAVTVGGFNIAGKVFQKLRTPQAVEQTDPNQLIEETQKEIEEVEKENEEQQEVEEETSIEVTPVTTDEDNYNYYKKPSTNTTNNSTNNGGSSNNNNSNNGGSDNSNDITVPVTPEEENNNNSDEPVVAPDAEIEDNNQNNDEDIKIEDAEIEDDNITITPEENEDITIEDDNSFDNKEEVEESYKEDQEENITVEDAEIEDSNTNENDEIIFDNSSDFEKPQLDEEIKIEDSNDDAITNPVEPPVTETSSTIDIQVNQDEKFSITDSKGDSYEYNNSENLYTNSNSDAKHITENSGTESITTGEADTITIQTETVERDHELTKEELQQLREEFANLTGNDIVEETKSR